jgi:hypothetical protein
MPAEPAFRVSRASEVSPGHTSEFLVNANHITYGTERAATLKDPKGLGYLTHPLRRLGTEFHVLDLAGGIAGQRDDA